MGHVAVTADLVTGIDNDDTLVEVVCQDSRHLANDGGLSDTGPVDRDCEGSNLPS
jgi:hypothetical protein